MPRIRFRDDSSSTTASLLGALAGAAIGFAAGLYVAKEFGGVEGIRERIRRRRGLVPVPATAIDSDHELDEYEEDELEEEGADLDADVEVRVLEAFRNDPILCERAVDIGSIGTGIVELSGWVDTEDEAHHAVTLARGVPGVDTVVNRLAVGDEEAQLDQAAERFADGDPSLTGARWEGNTVGIGRRRQGTSDDPDRHADPRVDLEERWSSTDRALQEAADDTPATAPPRARARRGPRDDSTTEVPRADHVS